VQILQNPVIITASISGGIHSPTMLASIPRDPEAIAEAALKAVDAGASVVSIHGRIAPEGRPGGSAGLGAAVAKIRRESGAIVQLSAASSEPTRERIEAIAALKPDLAAVPLGSQDKWLHQYVAAYPAWKYEWEREALERTRGSVFVVTHDDIVGYAEACRTHGVAPLLEFSDASHLAHADTLRAEGVFSGFQRAHLNLGAGIGRRIDDLLSAGQALQRTFGDGFAWSVSGAGVAQMGIAAQGALMGAHVRVGLDESVNVLPGQPAHGGAADAVRHVALLLKQLGLPVASPAQAREILRL